jgi:argininosuccinate lyase
MPQKRNPVAFEHARAIGSKALGQAMAVITTVHNTPFGDIVDTEDDLQPLVFAMFRDASRVVTLVAAAMATAQFDAVRLEARAADGWTTLTELADTLARDRGLPFRAAHAISSRMMTGRQQDPGATLSQLLAAASTEVLGSPIAYSDAELETILSPRHFVAVRQTHGGPAPEVTARATAVSRQQLADDEGWSRTASAALAAAEQRLAERSRAL